MVIYSNKLNMVFPIKLFLPEYLFLKNKYVTVQYIYLKFYNFSFFKSIKFVNDIYYTMFKLITRIKKSNVITRNNLSKSTKKILMQKGLGKARVGSLKSPIHRGGSVLFGPISRILSIILQIKKTKLSFCYLLLNKRTYISFIFLTPLIHTFNTFSEHIYQQKRINGLFSSKFKYIFLTDIKYIKDKNYLLSSLHSLNIISFLNFDYIIFLM